MRLIISIFLVLTCTVITASPSEQEWQMFEETYDIKPGHYVIQVKSEADYKQIVTIFPYPMTQRVDYSKKRQLVYIKTQFDYARVRQMLKLFFENPTVYPGLTPKHKTMDSRFDENIHECLVPTGELLYGFDTKENLNAFGHQIKTYMTNIQTKSVGEEGDQRYMVKLRPTVPTPTLKGLFKYGAIIGEGRVAKSGIYLIPIPKKQDI